MTIHEFWLIAAYKTAGAEPTVKPMTRAELLAMDKAFTSGTLGKNK